MTVQKKGVRWAARRCRSHELGCAVARVLLAGSPSAGLSASVGWYMRPAINLDACMRSHSKSYSGVKTSESPRFRRVPATPCRQPQRYSSLSPVAILRAWAQEKGQATREYIPSDGQPPKIATAQ